MQLTFPLKLLVLMLAGAAATSGFALAQPKPIDPYVRNREMRVARIMLENIHDDAIALLKDKECEKFEKLRIQLSGFSESPNRIGQATGAGPGELSQDDLVQLSAYAGTLRERLAGDCPRTASVPEPVGIQTLKSASGGGDKAGGSSLTRLPPPPPQRQGEFVIFITGHDKNGGWISGDFGRTRHYIAINKTTFDNPLIDDDDLPPPPSYLRCEKQRCEVAKPDPKQALINKAQEDNKQTKTTVTPEATKSGLEKSLKGGSTKGPDAPTKTDKAQKSDTKQAAVGRDTGGFHTASALAWLFLDEKFQSPMTSIDPPKLAVTVPPVTEQQGADQLKVVDAAEILMRDAYTAALDGVVSDEFAMLVIRHAASDTGIVLLSEQTLGKKIELTAEQRGRLNNFGATRIKDLQLTAAKASGIDGAQGTAGSGNAAKKDGVQPSNAKAAAKTVRQQAPAQTNTAPSQTNELGQQLLQGVIGFGIQQGLGTLGGGRGGGDGESMQRHSAPAMKSGGGAKAAKPSATTTAKPSTGTTPAAPGGSYLFQGFTGPSDVRLKHDIHPVARHESGVTLYRYRYLWSDTEYVGVMAQEIADVAPDAVLSGADGFLRVDYGKLGMRLMTWAEWQGPTLTEMARAP